MSIMISQDIKGIISKLPDTPGVYFFRAKNGDAVYIGKATSLKDRVRSYFSQDIAVTRGPKIVKMLEEFESIDFQQTDSVLEALILEAILIRKYQPIYNTAQKDNKSFNFVVITKEAWPRVLLARGHELMMASHNGDVLDYTIAYSFGPFPNGGALRVALEMIRKIFPYRDSKCIPYDEQLKIFESRPRKSTSVPYGSVSCKPCFNRQIGLCPGVCTGEITKEEYKAQVQNIVEFFKGNKKKIIKNLENEMKVFAKSREFEKAGEIKRQIFALNHIHDVALIKNDFQESRIMNQESIFRIEAYDVAHMSGKNVVGVMTVVENGTVNRSEYRKFKIRENPPNSANSRVGRPATAGLAGNNDVASLKQILNRRLNHDEWHLPNLIVVDGALAQRNAALSVLDEFGYKIPVVAVTKNEYHKPKNILGLPALQARALRAGDKEYLSYESDILLANSEAHRYAIGFHKKLREKIK